MTHTSNMEKLANVIRSSVESGAVAISRETTANDVRGWDSLSHTLIIMNVEEAFGIELPIEQTNELKNVGELLDLVEALLTK